MSSLVWQIFMDAIQYITENPVTGELSIKGIWESLSSLLSAVHSQSCLTLCNPMDYVAHQAPLSMGILQARIQEWVAKPSSRGSFQTRDRTQVSHIARWFFMVWATREALYAK